jgi:sterol 3beta-glucosyltransferase
MRISVVAIGSQGDVRPFTALASGLARSGHRVTLVTHREFQPLAERNGVDFAPVSVNPVEIVQSERGQAWISASSSPALFMVRMFRIASALLDDITREARRGAEGSDAVVYSMPLSVAGLTVAESIGVPAISASLYPIHPTGRFPSIMTPDFPIHGAFVNRASAAISSGVYWSMLRRFHNGIRRRELGLPALPIRSSFRRGARGRYLHLCGYSDAVIPRPDDWPDFVEVCGYWFLDDADGYRPPRELQAFLDAGDPPVYIGFGSMVSGDPRGMTRTVLDALGLSGKRAIVASGWGGLQPGDLPQTVFPVSFVPHGWLFPRVAAAVHHGGAGTAAAALRAGVPSIVVPFFADQFFWGKLLCDHALGAASIPRKRLTAERLAAALTRAATDRDLIENCRRVAVAVAAEDGVGRAVSAIERFLRVPS